MPVIRAFFMIPFLLEGYLLACRQPRIIFVPLPTAQDNRGNPFKESFQGILSRSLSVRLDPDGRQMPQIKRSSEEILS
jgi:hypothetical protein